MLLQRSIAWVSASAISSGLVLVYSVVLNRGLGPGGRGAFAVFLVVVNLAAGVLALGVGIVARAEAGRDPALASRIHTVTVLWSILGGIAVGLALLLGSIIGGRWAEVLPAKPALVALGVGSLTYLTQWQLISQAIGRYRAINVQRIARAGLQLCAIASGFALFQASPSTAVFAWVAAAMCAVTLAFWQYPVPRLAGTVRQALSHLGSYLAHGLKVTVGTQATGLQQPLVLLLLAAWGTRAEVGVYAVAFGLATQFAAVAGAPAVVSVDQLASADRRGAEERAFLLSRFYWTAAIPVALLVATVAPPVVAGLYGEAFRAAGTLVPLLVVGFIAGQATEGYSQLLMAQFKAFRLCATLNVATLVGLAAASPFLIRSFGARGAAASLSLAYAANAAAYSMFALRRTGRTLFRETFLLRRSDLELMRRSVVGKKKVAL